MSEFLMDIVSGEQYIEELLELTTHISLSYSTALLEMGTPAIAFGEALAGPDVVSSDHYRTYGQPYERKLIQELHKREYVIANHIYGNVDAIFDDMMGTEADILEIDEKTDVAEAKSPTTCKALKQ